MSANWTAAAAPLLQTGAVEEVLAKDCDESGRVIHAFKADGAGGEFNEGGCWWGKRL